MIPNFQSIMFPLLKITGDKKEYVMQEVRDLLAKYFNLTEEENQNFYLRVNNKYLIIELDGQEHI